MHVCCVFYVQAWIAHHTHALSFAKGIIHRDFWTSSMFKSLLGPSRNWKNSSVSRWVPLFCIKLNFLRTQYMFLACLKISPYWPINAPLLLILRGWMHICWIPYTVLYQTLYTWPCRFILPLFIYVFYSYVALLLYTLNFGIPPIHIAKSTTPPPPGHICRWHPQKNIIYAQNLRCNGGEGLE